MTPILDGIRSFFETVWNAICETVSTVLETIRSVVETVWNAISGFISTILNAIWSVVQSIWNAVSSYIASVLNTIFSTVSAVWNKIKSTINSVMNLIHTIISSIWDKVKTAVAQKITVIKDTIVNGFNTAVSFIKGLATQAFSWGADIIGNIVNGIRSKIQSVASAVTDIADTIRSYLHFSVPDTGPLTDFHSWMPDFMKGLADGINKSKKYVETAVASVADSMQLTMQSGLALNVDGISGAMIQGGSEPVVNNYNTYNNQTFNQTNNSPKAVNRYEIYRQTKNLIHTVKTGK